MTKTNLAPLFIACVFTLGLISSCKKDEKDEPAAPSPQLDSQVKQHNDDSNNYNSESDQADDDINNAVQNVTGFGKFAGIQSSPLCGCTIDSSQLAQKTLFFNFDGITPCFSPSRTRSGQIKVELTTGNLWSDVGSVLTLTYTDFKITRLSDNKFIMFNGNKTLKNINGNNWLGFLLGTDTLKYQSRAFNVHVDFTGGAQATWNAAHTTQWVYKPSGISGPQIDFSAIGDTSFNGFNNISGWGVNRYGQSFTTYYTGAWNSNTYCGLWRPVSGELIHNVNSANYTFTLGVNQSGSPSTLDCAYGFKVSWLYNGTPVSVVLSY